MDYKYIHNGTINIYVLFISGNHVIENDFRSLKEVNTVGIKYAETFHIHVSTVLSMGIPNFRDGT